MIEKTNWKLTLFSRHSDRLNIDTTREIAMHGVVLNKKELRKAIEGQDAVFVALSGRLDEMAKVIADTMYELHVKRIIFISSMGIYNEIPNHIGSNGNLKFNSFLTPYRKAADIIEKSGLDYTIIRPGWFDNGSDTYTISTKGQLFEGHNISRQAIANFVLELLKNPESYINDSVGIHRPE
ncbi:NAD(P)H-binding protein [Staphylococcus sp. IVB6214]|uniref:NAD(P)H-binding protein n=1 Tax=Staphylococcus sp. IVB6214 TaxID=2989766 RepID=UPI0021D39598|nr:NAD(P)H-binding protein [Staphylococcus sp. IVB6214]UXR83324.1 NAD(P)H-binding protein [Staphylococcus sp. IVB6214]